MQLGLIEISRKFIRLLMDKCGNKKCTTVMLRVKVKIQQSTVDVAAGRRIQVIRRLMIGDEGKWANAANAFFVSAKQQIMCIVSIVMFKLVHQTPLN